VITTACSVAYCNGACRGLNKKEIVFVLVKKKPSGPLKAT
jgi:hypothetical protein